MKLWKWAGSSANLESQLFSLELRSNSQDTNLKYEA